MPHEKKQKREAKIKLVKKPIYNYQKQEFGFGSVSNKKEDDNVQILEELSQLVVDN